MFTRIRGAKINLVASFSGPIDVALAVEIVVRFEAVSTMLARVAFARIVMAGVSVLLVYTFAVLTASTGAVISTYLNGGASFATEVFPVALLSCPRRRGTVTTWTSNCIHTLCVVIARVPRTVQTLVRAQRVAT